MLMLRVCHTCDAILGEVETESLTNEPGNSIMDIVGNVAYTVCPACLRQMAVTPAKMYH